MLDAVSNMTKIWNNSPSAHLRSFAV